MGISIPKLLLILPTRQKNNGNVHGDPSSGTPSGPFNFRKIAPLLNTIRETQERSLLQVNGYSLMQSKKKPHDARLKKRLLLF
jgi:hypothetical protein